MFRLGGVVVLVGLSLATGAQADSAVMCVQQELTALGHDTGSADGHFGAKTTSAFSELKAAEAGRIAAIDAPAFAASSAEAWCIALGTTFSEAGPIYQNYKDTTEGGFSFDVAPNAPPRLVAEVKDGLSLARAYIAKTFGAEIGLDARRRMTVKIVATGKGNTEPAGGGGVATAFSAGYDVPRPFFDVVNEQWSQNTRGRGWTTHADNMKSVVHEYTHGWQMMLGALDINNQPLGNWMNEGIAEYVAYSAMADAGLINWRDAQRFMTRAAAGVETDHGLAVFGSTQTPAWAGHVGFVALDWLITDTGTGIAAVKTIALEVAKGRSQKEAFANTFGLGLADFYEQFDTWAKAIRKNPDRALANRPKLILAGGAGSIAETAATRGLGKADPLAAEKCVQAGLNASGFPVGAADGQIGNGTKAAFEKYKRGLDRMAQSMPFQKGTYAMWCLYMTGNSPLSGDPAQLQAQVEAGAKLVLGFKVPKGTSFRVVMRKGETALVGLQSPQWNDAVGEYRAEFDYDPVKQADTMCAVFDDGWKVKDQAGKTYDASCDPAIPAMMTAGEVVWIYSVVPPAAKPDVGTGAPAPADSAGHLATKGDPNPGLDLIPHGWNGIYQAADMVAGQWQARKYSGQVDTYVSCKLLNDMYIICQ